MPDFYFLGGEIVHYPLSNGVDEVSEQFFFAQTGFSTVCSASLPHGQAFVESVFSTTKYVVTGRNTLSLEL